MGPEPGTSGLEKTAPSGELEFFDRSTQNNLLQFFQFDLEENSSSPEGAVFSRPDVPGSAAGYARQPKMLRFFWWRSQKLGTDS